MSDAVRSYGTLASGPRPRRRGRFRGFLVLAILAAVGYAWFSTRDTWPAPRLIPGDQKFWLAVTNIAEKRQKVAQSDVIKSLSGWFDTSALQRALQQDIPLPSWVVNNLMGETCYISGNDIDQFSDVLIVTKMTRVGAILERLHGFSSSVEDDPAGGLALRKIAGQSVYYAARGRILAISPSRDALIRALTLRPEECASGKALARALEQSGSEDLRGSISFEKGDPLGDVVESMRFALRIDPAQAKLICRATLRPDVESRLGLLLRDASPQQLRAPVDGMLVVSADFRKPVPDVWAGLGEALGMPALSAEKWETWKQLPEEGPAGVPQVLTAVLDEAGPDVSLSWCGMDLNEMLPVPEIVGVFDAGRVSLENVYASFPPIPEDTPAWEAYPRYDAKQKRMVVPLVGGPSLKPTAAAYGNGLLVSTSSAVADRLLAKPAATATLPQPGNLYVRMRPLPCVQAVAGAARQLVEIDALKGYTRESFEAEVRQWAEKAQAIDDVSVLLSVDRGEVLGELTVATRLGETIAPKG